MSKEQCIDLRSYTKLFKLPWQRCLKAQTTLTSLLLFCSNLPGLQGGEVSSTPPSAISMLWFKYTLPTPDSRASDQRSTHPEHASEELPTKFQLRIDVDIKNLKSTTISIRKPSFLIQFQDDKSRTTFGASLISISPRSLHRRRHHTRILANPTAKAEF